MSARRAQALAASLGERDLDLLLVSDLVNLRYLTGFTGSNGAALIGPDERRFVTDFRYVEQAAAQVPDFDRAQCGPDLLASVAELIGDRQLRLGFDAASLSVADHARLQDALADGITLAPAAGLVEGLRAIKDEGEAAAIAAATALADEALQAVLERGLVGRSEADVALDLEVEIRRRGAEAVSFEPIVAAGAHGALPHAAPRDAAIPRDTLVVIDWGARLDGYCSDCTRTYATGETISDEMREVYALVLASQLAALQAVTAGAGGRDVDAVARAAIEAGGHGEHFGHGLGHGVGLDVHEAPRLAKSSEAVLAAGNVVTVEPGIYLPGGFGVRIEDLVVVTDQEADVLTGLPKDLTVIA